MPLERRLRVVEAYVRRATGRAARVQTIGFSDLNRADMMAMSRVLNSGPGEFPVVFVGDAVACAGDYDLSAIVACASTTGSPTPTTYSETKENPDA